MDGVKYLCRFHNNGQSTLQNICINKTYENKTCMYWKPTSTRKSFMIPMKENMLEMEFFSLY